VKACGKQSVKEILAERDVCFDILFLTNISSAFYFEDNC